MKTVLLPRGLVFQCHGTFERTFDPVLWLLSNKTIIFQGSRRGPTFSRGGGVQIFPGGGVQSLIPYRIPYNLSFSRGGGSRPPALPPLDPPMNLKKQSSYHNLKISTCDPQYTKRTVLFLLHQYLGESIRMKMVNKFSFLKESLPS